MNDDFKLFFNIGVSIFLLIVGAFNVYNLGIVFLMGSWIILIFTPRKLWDNSLIEEVI